jgi:hypothetical protein
MKVSDIISTVLSARAPAEHPELDVAKPADFENGPDENYIDMKTMFSVGNDLNKPKHPADIRTNAPSMYPGHQHDPNK